LNCKKHAYKCEFIAKARAPRDKKSIKPKKDLSASQNNLSQTALASSNAPESPIEEIDRSNQSLQFVHSLFRRDDMRDSLELQHRDIELILYDSATVPFELQPFNNADSTQANVKLWDHLTLYAQTITNIHGRRIPWTDIYYQVVYPIAPLMPRTTFERNYFQLPLILVHIMFGCALLYSNSLPMRILSQYFELFKKWKLEPKLKNFFNTTIKCQLMVFEFAFGDMNACSRIFREFVNDIPLLWDEFQVLFKTQLKHLFEPTGEGEDEGVQSSNLEEQSSLYQLTVFLF
jgi:hypothetical protein